MEPPPGFDLGWSFMEKVTLAIFIALGLGVLGCAGFAAFVLWSFWRLSHG